MSLLDFLLADFLRLVKQNYEWWADVSDCYQISIPSPWWSFTSNKGIKSSWSLYLKYTTRNNKYRIRCYCLVTFDTYNSIHRVDSTLDDSDSLAYRSSQTSCATNHIATSFAWLCEWACDELQCDHLDFWIHTSNSYPSSQWDLSPITHSFPSHDWWWRAFIIICSSHKLHLSVSASSSAVPLGDDWYSNTVNNEIRCRSFVFIVAIHTRRIIRTRP